jgi:deoxyribonuclease IV
MPRLIGAHTIDTGGIAMAARRAGNAGMTALQIFSAVPKFYNEKVSVKPERVRAFQAALAEAGIALDAVIVHAGYVLNCATPEAEKWERRSVCVACVFILVPRPTRIETPG